MMPAPASTVAAAWPGAVKKRRGCSRTSSHSSRSRRTISMHSGSEHSQIPALADKGHPSDELHVVSRGLDLLVRLPETRLSFSDPLLDQVDLGHTRVFPCSRCRISRSMYSDVTSVFSISAAITWTFLRKRRAAERRSSNTASEADQDARLVRPSSAR